VLKEHVKGTAKMKSIITMRWRGTCINNMDGSADIDTCSAKLDDTSKGKKLV
jgi:hypothetical protein